MRTPRKEKTSLKKGAWTLEEDEKLKAYITRYGIWNWTEMPKFAGLSRSGKSCRLRWMNYLRPDIKRENFTKKEEETIINLHSVFGNSWSAIASKLPGRTDNHVKNHWHTYLKKRVEENCVLSTDDQQQELRTSNSEAHVENVREPNTFTDNVSVTPCASEDGSSLSSTSSTTMCDHHDTNFYSGFEFQIDQEWYQDNLPWFYDDEYWSNLLLQAEMAGVMEQPTFYF